MTSRTSSRKTAAKSSKTGVKATSSAAEAVVQGQVVQAQIEELDALYASAGLRRSRREKAAGVRERAKSQEKTPEELRSKAAVTERAANGVELVRAPGWEKLPWLWHGFGTRVGGVSRAYTDADGQGELNLGFTAEDARENVVRNRELLAEAVTGSAETPIATIKQIHSNVVALAAEAVSGPVCGGDGLITDRPGLLVGVLTADCIPVLVADTKRRVVGAFHAGWRGTVKRIVESGIGRMRLEFGSRPEDLVAAVGPGIGPCCYTVGEEVLSEFSSQFAYAPELFHEVYDGDPVKTKYPMLFLTQRAPGHSPMGPGLHLDVAEANRRQLLDAGVKAGKIRMVGGCTKCQPELFFSHRGGNGRAGRMLSVIGVKAGK
jgi:YfiH family protein